MFVKCPRCAEELEFSNRPPRFCSACGGPIDAEATLAFARPTSRSDVPDVVGGFRLLRLLGSGGMGSVYEAEDAAGRRVALKLIRPEYLDSPDAVERFRREGRLASTVIHPRCVFVLAADEDAGRPYIVMELMPGRTLNDLLKEGPLPVAAAVRHTLDVIEGLQEAHAGGVIHRDVKPSNCFLDGEGRVKVGDFGLAKTLAGGDHLTRSGAFLGTFLFASPEQIRSDKVDHLTDVYSVSATLYCLLTGRAPFEDTDAAAAVAKTVSDPLRPMRTLRPDLPATLDEVVLKGLARPRAQRWQSLEELRLELLPFIDGAHSLAELAARAGAYALDAAASVPLLLTAQALTGVTAGLGNVGVTLAVFALYFGVPEAVHGCTPGKWLLRLRVRRAAGGDRPTLAQALLRTAAFVLLTDGSVEATVSLFRLSELAESGFSTLTSMLLALAGLTGLPLLAMTLGLAAVASTMRRANGYRGLHEVLSGTRTIRLPGGRPRFVMPARQEWPTHAAPPDGLPARLGAFRVIGVARVGPDEAILYGADASLDRPVWLFLHAGPLPPARREAARATRPRWLAGGEHDGRRWDAFVATPGCLLADLMGRRGRLPWRDAHLLLEHLTDELLAAEADGTLPGLSPEQVWVQPTGRVLLLDAAPREPRPAASPLGFLRAVAVEALEGKPRPAEAGLIRAPLPGHGRALMNRLMSDGGFLTLVEVKRSLEEVRDLPDEISWPGRALQAGLCGLACLPGLLGLFLLGPALLGAALMMCAAGEAQLMVGWDGPGPHPGVALRRQQDAVLESSLWLIRPQLAEFATKSRDQAVRQLLEQAEDDPLVTASDDLTGGPAVPAGELLRGWWTLLALLAWPLAWALGSALTRGGLSLWLVGIHLLDRRGRQAARWRCAARTLLVWLPVALLLAASLFLDAWRVAHAGAYGRPSLGSAWLSQLCWWGALGLLPAYAAVAALRPNRGPHDRLAGTYPVP